MTRTVRDAAAAGALEVSPAPNFALSCELGWLTSEAHQEVRKLIGRLKVIMDRSKLRGEGDLYMTRAISCPVMRKRGAAADSQAVTSRAKRTSRTLPLR